MAELDAESGGEAEYVCGTPLITDPAQERLTERRVVDYREERRDLLEWLRDLGKKPNEGEGYAADTVYNRSYRIDGFYRWVWNEEDGYTTAVTTDHADAYCRDLLSGDHSDSHRSNTQKALTGTITSRRRRSASRWIGSGNCGLPTTTSSSRTMDHRATAPITMFGVPGLRGSGLTVTHPTHSVAVSSHGSIQFFRSAQIRPIPSLTALRWDTAALKPVESAIEDLSRCLFTTCGRVSLEYVLANVPLGSLSDCVDVPGGVLSHLTRLCIIYLRTE
ncbi:hypothetical protein [Halobellus ruber]|uniref:hypothetical protein n=1 Tax=Halobellus ruber TaxID=2761102 RepID=UPI001FE3E08B|nr:hypothetical protein [Halobellus ruber]